MTRVNFFVLLVFLVCACPAWAQEPVHQHVDTAQPANSTWVWTTDANVFFGFNYQDRRYSDFAAWESQNWFMATAEHPVGRGRLVVAGMLSLEPLTIGRYVYLVGGPRFRPGGSPQLFQTGESYQRIPLVDFQHPHDLIATLGATYRIPGERVTWAFGVDAVGTPTLGPVPFMHRESARNNPQVPLTHHQLDSTHSTPGVVRLGVEVSGWTLETSAFRGEEPDEQRYDIDPPRLDSWAGRVGWRHGPWQAQFSGGSLHAPEWFEPYDQTRLTASIAFNQPIASRPFAATLAWGETREYTPSRGILDGYLLEWDLRATRSLSTYGRTEIAKKEIFGHGFHPRGVGHPHIVSNITAVTVGAVHDLSFFRWGRFGIGGDVTVYGMSPELEGPFGGSKSFHAFLRWRAPGSAAHIH